VISNPQIAFIHQNSNQYLNSSNNQSGQEKTLNNGIFYSGKGELSSINGVDSVNSIYVKSGIQNKTKNMLKEHFEITP